MAMDDIAYYRPCEACGGPCGVTVRSIRAGHPRRFCARECWRTWVKRNQVQASCEQCEGPAPRSVSLAARVSGAFCSPECHAASMQMTPDEHIASKLVHEDFERAPGWGPCWTWTGPYNPTTGYGVIRQRRDGKRTAIDVHRAAWEVASGQPIPDGLRVLHICDVRLCARNDERGSYEVRGVLLPRWGHLFLGTQADNMADAARKGRTALGDRNGSRTRIERMARGDRRPDSKLTDALVIDMRRRYAAGGVTHQQLADEAGIERSTMSRMLRGETWKHL